MTSGGVLVGAVAEADGQRIVRLGPKPDGSLKIELLGAVRTLTPLVVGLMRAL